MAKKTTSKTAKSAKKTTSKTKPATKAKPTPKVATKKAVSSKKAKTVKKIVASKKAKTVEKIVASKKATPAKKGAKKVIAKVSVKVVKKGVAKVAPKATPKKEVAKFKKQTPKGVVKKPVAEKKVVVEAERTHKPAAAPLKLSPSQLNVFPVINQRPIAHPQAKNTNEDKTHYNDEELKEFETIIIAKLDKAKEEFKILKDTLTRSNDAGTDSTSGGNTKVLEDGAETAEKENMSQLAARQLKYITNLENALIRIKNRTYGICSVTGKLISKERLIAVPHTTQSIEAKMMKQD